MTSASSQTASTNNQASKASSTIPAALNVDLFAAHGFALQKIQVVSELSAQVYQMVHEKSHARLLFIHNDDQDRAFAIAFKTPPKDDTGVFHILEHSVLCGSDKFPVKEPFVNLLKTSMQTFLNAMTFSDKTMYPVASTNEADLMNLMDVYLDAVFHPAIYREETIFAQEGWHLEVNPEIAGNPAASQDATPAESGVVSTESDSNGESPSPFYFNGVVFNEMKGALSEPDAVLYNGLTASLFPDTAYRFESGGTPEGIIGLTYQDFLSSHERHYRPENAWIILYGDLDAHKILGFLDQAYLTPLARARRLIALDEILDAPNPLDLQKPVVASGVEVSMVTAPENAEAALGFVVGTASDSLRVIATDILLDAIMGSNEAPLKKALLEAQIADEIYGSLADSLLQPFVSIVAKGTKSVDAADRLQAILTEEVKRLVNGDLDHNLVEAALSYAEFGLREHDRGISDGVAYAITAMAGWLYDDDAALAYLSYEDTFAQLRQLLPQNYFETLLEELFLQNPHRAQVSLKPLDRQEDDAVAKALVLWKERLGEEGLDLVASDTEILREAQEAPDDPRDLATLPMLSLSDLGAGSSEPPWALTTETPLPTLTHGLETHGILYMNRYFEVAVENPMKLEENLAQRQFNTTSRQSKFPTFTADELPWLSVIGLLLGKLDTAHHSAAEIDMLTSLHLGHLNFNPQVVEMAEPAALQMGAGAGETGAVSSLTSDQSNPARNAREDLSYRVLFDCSAACLSSSIPEATALINEILTETDFSDIERIRRILVQQKVAFEQMLITAGQMVAMRRVASYYLPAGVVREALEGFTFYERLGVLLAELDSNPEGFSATLQALTRRLFVDAATTISLAGSTQDCEVFWQVGASLGQSPNKPLTPVAATPWQCSSTSEAIIVPSNVCYSAVGYDRRLLKQAPSGLWSVASRVLSYDYLWSEIRVKGGAYGAGFPVGRDGSLAFYTYRDPHLDESLRTIEQAGAWLSRFDPSESEMDGYIISTTSGFDAPIKPRAMLQRQDNEYFSGYEAAWRSLRRSEVIEASVDGVRALGAAICEATAQHQICTVGAKTLLQSSSEDFQILNPFGL